jgi:outer membrane protein insertion porin family
MSSFSFRLASIPVIILGVLVLSAGALGQTGTSPIAVPCQAVDTPSRPILKRREQTPEDSTAKEEKIVPKSDESQNCKPQGESEIISEPIKEEGKLAIRFEGLVGVDESDLRKELREHRVQFPKDPLLEADLVEKASSTVRERLVAWGYRHAAVNTRVDQVGDSKTLVFIVSEGARPSIAEFRFEGNRIFPSRQLVDEIKQCMAHFDRDYYDPAVVDYCIRWLDNSARGRGYLKARFYDPQVGEVGGSLVVTLQVDEGILYRLGETKIVGASAFTEEQIRAMIALQKGDIANGEQISKALFEELKKAYGEKGYIQYTADITPTFQAAPDKLIGIVDFEITIDEGNRFKIRKIEFKGDNLPEEQLRQLLLIHGGDIFNQTLLEKSIDKLNGTGFFEPIDKDGDLDFRTNEEEGLVDITIKLIKRQNERGSE